MSTNGILRTAHVSGLLRRMYETAVASGRTVVVGVGNAVAMAEAFETH
ncbi:hypothetical protein [Rhodoferax sp.]|nr:hypothetical protein [Rhodoferax sp.]MCM2297054.1 hypothetical protein [Rhodoferax sp.]